MKKYIYSLFAAVLFLFSAGCSKDDDGSKNIDSGVVGEWRQTKWSNEAYADFDVYVEFSVRRDVQHLPEGGNSDLCVLFRRFCGQRCAAFGPLPRR